MLDRPAAATAATRADLLTFAQARMRAAEGGALAVLADWVETYLMQGHPDLGRTGAVCPFTRQAGKLDTIRMNLSLVGPDDEEAAFALTRRGFMPAMAPSPSH